MSKLTYAFCTYNRANRLKKLVNAIRAQKCPIPFEIVAINNNSSDNTSEVLNQLGQHPGPPLRWVTESAQGIVAARNRGIFESLSSDIMVFIDDDEIPLPGLLEAAVHAILNEGAECAGGRVKLDFSTIQRPRWLEDQLLGFLAAVDYGEEPFWIKDISTPIWTANVAYDMRIFRNNPHLRFDRRYDRIGNIYDGGEDAVMFKNLMERGIRIRYCPQMISLHDVDRRRLKRSYFIRLHHRSGFRHGQLELPKYSNALLGIPPFLIAHFIRDCLKTILRLLPGQSGFLRQAMTASFTLGQIRGYRKRLHT